ncbi:MAG: type II secretion system protein GspG [Wenzhouxiangella sp.]|nr:MAG: type II secretion system protein GspG [Wenzhouxiangella sp.]
MPFPECKSMQLSSASRHPARGFSLIEILVVVVIIGILAAIVVPRVMDEPDRARVTKAKQDIQALATALNMYRLDNYVYPSTEQGLEALVRRPAGQPEAPNWRQGGYLDRVPRDPWGRDYQYLYPGVHGEFDVWTFGANGMPGGEGVNAEIGNWGD